MVIYLLFLALVYVIQAGVFGLVWEKVRHLYTSFHRPEWALPLHWLFPVRFFFYTLIGIAGAHLWMAPHARARQVALWAWSVMVVLDAFWFFTFFYIPIPVLTPIVVSVVFGLLVVCIFESFLVCKAAAYLLIPFTLMTLHKLIFHWTFFLLNIQVM